MFFPLIAMIAMGQAPGLPPGLERDYSARNAAVDAHLDLLSLPIAEQACTFYVWDNCGTTPETCGAINYTVNALLNARPRLIFEVKVAGGRLLRYNLYDFAPYRSFDKLKKAFDKLADFDPVFHEPAAQPQVKRVWEYVTPYEATDHKWYNYVAKDVVEYRKIQPSIGSGGAGPLLLLEELSGLRQPILAADWMIPTFWSAIKIDGIVGQYYELRGIQVGGKPPYQQTDFDAFLTQFGVDPKKFKDLPSAQRTVMKSIVAKRYRQIEITPQTTVQPQYGPGILSATHDIANIEDDPAKDPLENLIDFKDAAREIIASLPCGLHAYLLTNGDGLAATEVPANVAAWPHSPHGDVGGGTLQLVPGISCLECHGPNRGWNQTTNTVRELKEAGFFAKFDFRIGRFSAKEFEAKLSDLYDGEINLPLKGAGIGYGLAADQVTHGAWGLKSVEGVSAQIFRIYAEYFKEVDTLRALQSLGYRWTGKDERLLLRAFNEVIPPEEGEPGRVGVLRINRPITRQQWNQIRFELSLKDRLHNEDRPPAAGPRLRFSATAPAKIAAMQPKEPALAAAPKNERPDDGRNNPDDRQPSRAGDVGLADLRRRALSAAGQAGSPASAAAAGRQAGQAASQETAAGVRGVGIFGVPDVPGSGQRQSAASAGQRHSSETQAGPTKDESARSAVEYTFGRPGITIYGEPGSHVWLGKRVEYMGRLNGNGVGRWDFHDLYKNETAYPFAVGEKWYHTELYVGWRTVVRAR